MKHGHLQIKHCSYLHIDACYAATMLLIATFLEYKTRSAGKSYDHLCLESIFTSQIKFHDPTFFCITYSSKLLSAIAGFIVTMNPLANYYTQFYSGALAIPWATMFLLVVISMPRLLSFYKQAVNFLTDQTISNKQC